MKKNIFKLKTKQLKEIAQSLQTKVENGLGKDNTEIQCIPTYINPKTSGIEVSALVLDLGGTNIVLPQLILLTERHLYIPRTDGKKTCP